MERDRRDEVIDCLAFREKLIEIGQSIISNGFNGKVRKLFNCLTVSVNGDDLRMGFLFKELFGCPASKMATSNDEVRGDSHWFSVPLVDSPTNSILCLPLPPPTRPRGRRSIRLAIEMRVGACYLI
jgi:hypothetical protein